MRGLTRQFPHKTRHKSSALERAGVTTHTGRTAGASSAVRSRALARAVSRNPAAKSAPTQLFTQRWRVGPVVRPGARSARMCARPLGAVRRSRRRGAQANV